MTANKRLALECGVLTGAGIFALLALPLPEHKFTSGSVDGQQAHATGQSKSEFDSRPDAIFEEHGIRPVYPHSLIPGGVRNAKEFMVAIGRDRVLASFFREYDASHATPCTLPHGKYFVTVRNGNAITWSKRAIEKGEQDCITDGRITILTKCGNEVSFIPQDPSQEVTSEEIAVPAYEVTNGDGRLLPVDAGVQPTPNGIVGLAPPTNGSQPYGQIPMPPILGIPVPPITILPVPPPTVQVPEPSTLGLSTVGIFILGFAAWINKRMRML